MHKPCILFRGSGDKILHLIGDIEILGTVIAHISRRTDHAARARAHASHTRTFDESMHVRARVGGQRRVGVRMYASDRQQISHENRTSSSIDS